MQAQLLENVCLVADGYHNAFTTLASWQGRYWLGFRRAATHNIATPGTIQIWTGPQETAFRHQATLTLPGRDHVDLRDPRFLATPSHLYCLIGAYHPMPPSRELRTDPAENLISTYITSTKDGRSWAPLTRILRPNYWGWSLLAIGKGFVCAAYHTGQHHETSSIVLWLGKTVYTMEPHVVCYDGATNQADRGPHYTPAEPVLFCPHTDTLACYVRSEKGMDIGVSCFPYTDWRWHNTQQRIHPSATVPTVHGRLLAGRSLSQTQRGLTTAQTTIWYAEAQHLTEILTLPSQGDCAYPGVVPRGGHPTEYYVSYYTQSKDHDRAGDRGADIYLARMSVHAETLSHTQGLLGSLDT